MSGFVQDLRYAARGLRRSPGFTFVVVLIVALGIGANTAVLSVIQSVLLTPLPYRNPERLVWIAENNVTTNNSLAMVFGSDLEEWSRHANSFDGLSALFVGDATINGDDPMRVRIACLSQSLTRLFGVSPALGRDFLPEEFEHAPQAPGLRASGGTTSASGVAVVSDRLFRRLDTDSRILGKLIVIGTVSYTVVGVLPPRFRLPVAPTLQLAIGPQPDIDVVLNTTVSATYRGPGAALGRLRSGVPIETAFAELEGIRAAANLSRTADARSTGLQLQVSSLHDHVVAGSRRVLLAVWASVGFVLLVACVNIISLLLARSVARQQEITLQTALGASRWRVVRQMLAENMLLILAGAVTGIALGYAAVRTLAQNDAINVPRLQDTTLNWTVLIFNVGVCAMIGLILGMIPALRTTVKIGDRLREDGRTLTSGRVQRWHSVLVVCELALALVPIMGASLMLQSLWQVRGEGAVLVPDRVLTAQIQSGNAQFSTTPASRLRDRDQVLEQVELLPSVQAAALWNMTFGYPARIAGLRSVKMSPLRCGSACLRTTAKPRECSWLQDVGLPIKIVPPRRWQSS